MNRLRPATNADPRQTESFTGRKKVTLAPGHSLMDWIRLGRAQGDLSGVGSHKQNITPGQLAVHNTQRDMWMAVRGNVYNLTAYLEYHPGGIDELMRAAGKDGTNLFDEIHNWVNVESMLEKCLVGPLIPDATSKAPNVKTVRSKSITYVPHSVQTPTYDWYQTPDEVIVVIYTKYEHMKHEFVIVDTLKAELIIQACIKDSSFFIHMKPAHALMCDSKVKVTAAGKVEVVLMKVDTACQWDTLGSPLSMNESLQRTKNIDCRYRSWTMMSNTAVTHDTRLLRFKAPVECRMLIPVGYHVHIKTDISGMVIARSYTAVVPSLTRPHLDSGILTGKTIFLMIKSYVGGAISPWITSLKPGDKVQLSNFDGNFDLMRLEKISSLVMFAAGTGFTSMINLIVYALYKMAQSTFPVKLVFFNKTQKDILWREQLDEMSRTFPRFSVTYVLSQESESTWKGLRGRVSMEHVKSFVPTPSETPNPLFCICGQWAYNDAVESFAKLNGLQEEHIHVFCQIN